MPGMAVHPSLRLGSRKIRECDMARSSEKAMSLMNRWVDQQRAISSGSINLEHRPRAANECRTVREADAQGVEEKDARGDREGKAECVSTGDAEPLPVAGAPERVGGADAVGAGSG